MACKLSITTTLIFVCLFTFGCGESTDPDTTPPKIKLLAPSPGLVVDDSVQVEVFADDDTEVKAVLLLVGRDTVESMQKKPWKTTLKLQSYPDGPVEIVAVAVDGAGNSSKTDPVIIIVQHKFSVSINNKLPTDIFLSALNQIIVLSPGAAYTANFPSRPPEFLYEAIAYNMAPGANFDTIPRNGRRTGEIITISGSIDMAIASGNLSIEINIPKEYFFALIQNSGNNSLGPFTVGATTDSVVIPNDGAIHKLGYYKSSENKITAGGVGGSGKIWTVELPKDTLNRVLLFKN